MSSIALSSILRRVDDDLDRYFECQMVRAFANTDIILKQLSDSITNHNRRVCYVRLAEYVPYTRYKSSKTKTALHSMKPSMILFGLLFVVSNFCSEIVKTNDRWSSAPNLILHSTLYAHSKDADPGLIQQWFDVRILNGKERVLGFKVFLFICMTSCKTNIS